MAAHVHKGITTARSSTTHILAGVDLYSATAILSEPEHINRPARCEPLDTGVPTPFTTPTPHAPVNLHHIEGAEAPCGSLHPCSACDCPCMRHRGSHAVEHRQGHGNVTDRLDNPSWHLSIFHAATYVKLCTASPPAATAATVNFRPAPSPSMHAQSSGAVARPPAARHDTGTPCCAAPPCFATAAAAGTRHAATPRDATSHANTTVSSVLPQPRMP